MTDFGYRVAFVTGGASGIGLAMAQAFVRLGVSVVVADSDQQYLHEASGLPCFSKRNAEFIRVDVTDRAAMADARDEARARFGSVDLLCNNAGVIGQASIDNANYGDWDTILAVNLGGVINGIVSFLPDMKAQRHGHIVNTGSMAALLPSSAGSGLYATSKFAVRGLTESLRLSVASYGIGVSLLCPGMVQTRILESSARRYDTEMDNPATRQLELDAMDPAEVAKQVVSGVRSNLAYIITHSGFRDEVAFYHEDILQFVPQGPPATQRFHVERRARLSEARNLANSLAR